MCRWAQEHPLKLKRGWIINQVCMWWNMLCLLLQLCRHTHLTNATGVAENYFIWRVGIISLALDTDDISSSLIHWRQIMKTRLYHAHCCSQVGWCEYILPITLLAAQ